MWIGNNNVTKEHMVTFLTKRSWQYEDLLYLPWRASGHSPSKLNMASSALPECFVHSSEHHNNGEKNNYVVYAKFDCSLPYPPKREREKKYSIFFLYLNLFLLFTTMSFLYIRLNVSDG